ncbi:hypothetical protein RJ641_023374 [Dillenia turbinata]|uniref:Uncharacterized protein n=1 Tax=Dillenia turbinata TaxID=194707 RepID=A0AAN8YSH7_9MAGN
MAKTTWHGGLNSSPSLLNLYGFIDGTSIAPPKTIASATTPITQIPNPEYDLWFKKDQLFLSWILSSLTEDIFSYIINLSSSFAVWEALARAFGSVSSNRQLQLNIELQEFKRNDLSVSTYLQCAKALADKLSTAGRLLSSAEFNTIIYCNIGSDFHSIITALNLCPDPVPFYELHAHLVAHEILLKATRLVSPALLQANLFLGLLRTASQLLLYWSSTIRTSGYGGHVSQPVWIPDIGATNYITPDLSTL